MRKQGNKIFHKTLNSSKTDVMKTEVEKVTGKELYTEWSKCLKASRKNI